MKTMNIPGFTAERSLEGTRGRHRGGPWVECRDRAPSSRRFRPAATAIDLSPIAREKIWQPAARRLGNACRFGKCYEENDPSHCRIDPISGRVICDNGAGYEAVTLDEVYGCRKPCFFTRMFAGARPLRPSPMLSTARCVAGM
jgi:hypothetical protein